MFKHFVKMMMLLVLLVSVPASSTPTRLKIGDRAPEISLPDLNGRTLKLSSQKGKLILVSFWSTWCVACNVVKNPEYVRLYNKYKNYAFKDADNFTFFSVAFDKDKNKWKRRIREAQLSWDTHVVDTDSYYSEYWFKYNIQSIPSSFLLDAQGKILGINMTYRQLDAELGRLKTGKRKPKPKSYTPAPPPPPVVTAPPPPAPLPPPTPPKPPVIVMQPKKPKQSPVIQPDLTAVYKIQLGVFRSPKIEKFNDLADLGQLEAEQANASLYRVLLGTFSNKGSKQVLAEVRKRGYVEAYRVKRVITGKPQPYTPPTAIPPPVDELAQFFRIQLGVFNAVDFGRFSNLVDLGILDAENTVNGLKRLLLGKYATRKQAGSYLATTRQRGYLDAFIVTRKATDPIAFNVFGAPEVPKVAQLMPTMAERALEFDEEEDIEEPVMMDLVKLPVLKQTMVGQVAPEIALQNTKGMVVPLSTVRQPTILYLWAAWSSEARANYPDLKKLHQQYADKGLAFYTVAFDTQIAAWKEVLAQEQLEGPYHLLDDRGMQSPLLSDYNAEMLPVIFLLDHNGNIVAENPDFQQLEQGILDVLK